MYRFNKTDGKRSRVFLRSLEKEIIPVYIEWNKAYFQATLSGKDEDYTKVSEYELAYSKMLADKDKFDKVKSYKANPAIKDSLIRRELEILYNTMSDTRLIQQR